MALPTDYTSGTITLTNGSAAFTGTGTGWQAASFREGDLILDIAGGDGRTAVIATITSATAGTLTQAWEGPTLVDVAYRMRNAWDAGRASAQSAMLREQLGNGNVQALSALEGPGVPVFNGPHSMTIKPEADFINGVAYDVQVDALADRDAYDAQSEGFAVLVSDVGDGRSAVYSKASNTSGDWTDPAYVTGPLGASPDLTFGTTITGAPGTPASVDVVPTVDGYELTFTIPAGQGFADGGEYDPGTEYDPFDVVLYNGSSFRAKVTTTGNAPPTLPTTENTQWILLARAGIDGSGTVSSVGQGSGISVDNSDPTAPVVNLADVPTATVKGRVAGGSGAPSDLTGTEVTTLLDGFTPDNGVDTAGLKGLVPAPAVGDAAAGKVLLATGTWGEPPSGGGGQFMGDNGTVGTSPGDIFRVNTNTLNADVTIPSDHNASATGPITVADTFTLQVAADGALTII